MKINYFIICLIYLIFFVISFLTNILGALNPIVSETYKLSETMAGFLPFSFFVAYGIMSIPSGFFVERWGEKKMMILSFFLAFMGTLFFALIPIYIVFLISLFTIGTGMAALQVVINPLLRVAGGEANFAFNSVVAQLVFGSASFVSPQMYSYLVKNIDAGNLDNPFIKIVTNLVPEANSWISVYWVFALLSILMITVILVTKFPEVTLKEDEKIGTKNSYFELFKNKYVLLFFLGIFAYVGTEQGISFWMSKYLHNYHGFDSATLGADAVSYFWGMMTIGGVFGLIAMKLFDTQQVLRWFTVAAMISIMVSLEADGSIAYWSFPISGFFLSVMYPSIVSLGLNSIDKHHGTFAGIMMTGIAGGAVIPFIIGGLSDLTSLKIGMTFIFITMGYILSISFWANPLIKNKTIDLKMVFNE